MHRYLDCVHARLSRAAQPRQQQTADTRRLRDSGQHDDMSG